MSSNNPFVVQSHDRHYLCSRRRFNQQLGLLTALVASFSPSSRAASRGTLAATGAPIRDVAHWQHEEPWLTLAGVQETLFPASEDGPGAGQLGCLDYLHGAIDNPLADGEDKVFIVKGVGWLNDLARQRHGEVFTELDEAHKAALIESITRSRAGRNWVSLLLMYLLEGAFAAPVYGGNRDRVGWQWLDYQAGYPLPPPDKTWERLRQRRYQL